MTIDTAGMTPAPPVAPVRAKNVFERMGGVLFSPGETFEDIARKPDILWPLLILVILGYITTPLMMRYMDFDAVFARQAEQMKKKNPNMSDADIERAGRIGKSMSKVVQFVGPALAIAVYALIALVLWGAVRMMGGEGDFKQAFSATLYAWVPLVLFSIILVIVVAARGSVDPEQMATVVKSNPAFLVDTQEHPVLASLLSSLDVFAIWTLVLLIFGFAALSRLSRTKTAAILISLWVVFLVVKIGFAALGAAMRG